MLNAAHVRVSWLCAAVLALATGALADNDPQAKGLRLPTATQRAWMARNMPETRAVPLNAIGARRVNAARSRAALPPVAEGTVLRGRDLLGLPTAVDNSKLKYFPPIRSQGAVGSCAAFALVYYTMGHMTAMARDWDQTNNSDNTKKFSPKFVYNMVNGGADLGSWYEWDLLKQHGAPPWADYPYDGDYLAWSTSGTVWRNAINYRMDQSGTVSNCDTDAGLTTLKQLFVNGYLLNYGTGISSWQYMKIKDDASTTGDNTEVGKDVCYWADGSNGAHAMTVVGYNDEIWIDINGNSTVDAGEKGALRIANSWGSSWRDGGFTWLAYDALKATSAVTGGPTNGRTPVWWSNACYWLTARQTYTPKTVAYFTLNTANRSEIAANVGVSDALSSVPTTLWSPRCLQYQGGAFGFGGTASAIDGTFCFDLSDIFASDYTPSNLYARLNDAVAGNSSALKLLRVVDEVHSNAERSNGNARTADNSTVTLSVTYPFGTPRLNFVVSPGLSTAGQTITPAVQVEVLDQNGNRDTAFYGDIAVAMGTNPTGATLSGTLTKPVINGIANFNDLSVSRGGVGFTLTATQRTCIGAGSTPFMVVSGAPLPAPFSDDFSNDLGWLGYGSGGWMRGATTANSVGDPAVDHTPVQNPDTNPTDDNYVLGYNLSGTYTNSLSESLIISPPINCSALNTVTLSFWRWLGVQATDVAAIKVSTNGSTWTTVWSNAGTAITDTAWAKFSYDISTQAARKPMVFIGFAMGATDASGVSYGWNVDDLVLYQPVLVNHFDVVTTSPQIMGRKWTGTNTITAKDAANQTITNFDAGAYPVTVTFTPTGVTAEGLGSAKANVIDQPTGFVSGVADLTGLLKTVGTPGTYTLVATNKNGSGAGTPVVINAAPIAVPPFSEGFEAQPDAVPPVLPGNLSLVWDTWSSTDAGRIRVSPQYSPHGGTYQLLLDVGTDNTPNLNEAVLTCNLTGKRGVALTFWEKEFGNEPFAMPDSFTGHSNSCGVAISADGVTWYRVVQLGGKGGQWTQYTVDLDAATAAAGISYADKFYIKFQQYDNYPIEIDGMAFDDIQLIAGAAASTSTITADKTSLTADNAALVTFTITAKSPGGTPVAGIAGSSIVVASDAASGVTITQPTAATNAAGQTTATAKSSSAGDFTFRVNIDGTAVTQTCLVKFTPVTDSYEPDDTWQTAKAITFGKSQTNHSAHSTADVDFVSFSLTKPTWVKAATNIASTVWLYRAGSSTADLIETGASPRNLLLEAGSYFAAFKPGVTVAPYAISVGAGSDTYESDDTPQTASMLTEYSPQVHSWHSATDVDWIKFTVTKAGQPVQIATDVASKLSLYADGATPLLLNSGQPICREFAVGTYLVKVTAPAGELVGAYNLAMKVGYETNDKWSTATPFELGSTQHQAFETGVETDWLKFVVTQAGRYGLKLSPLQAKVWLHQDTTGRGTLSQLFYSAKTDTATWDLLPGTYYVCLKSWTSGVYGPYDVTIGPVLEPNDTWQTANALALDKVSYQAFESTSDVDWVSYTLTGTYRLTATLSRNAKITLYRGNGVNPPTLLETVTAASVARDQDAGTYFLAIEPVSGDPTGSYTVMLNTGAAYEPNDTWRDANAFTLGTTQHQAFENGTEVDWVKFTLTIGGISQAVTVNTTRQSKIWLYRDNGAGGITLLYSNASTKSITRDLTVGTYYVQLKSYSSGAYGAYDLTISTTGPGAPPALAASDPAAAQPIALGETQARVIAAGIDWSTFVLTTPQQVKLSATGAAPIECWLTDSRQAVLAYSAGGSVERNLPAGRYQVAVVGASGAYELALAGGAARAWCSARDWYAALVVSTPQAQQARVFGVGGQTTHAPRPLWEQLQPLATSFVVDGGARSALDQRSAPAPAQAWRLAIDAPAGERVALSWPELGRALPTGYRARLTDLETGQRVFCQQAGGYTFTAGALGRQLLLEIDARPLARTAIVSLATAPSRGGLVAVTWQLNAPAQMRLEVAGANGTLVKRASVAAPAGLGSWTWDGRDGDGRAVPAGVYRLRALAVGADGDQVRAERLLTVR